MPSLPEGRHLELLNDALRVEAEGQRALLAGDDVAASRLADASALYRASWEEAGPDSYGRLIGMLKAAVLAGDAAGAADYAARELGAVVHASPAAAYAQAIAALVRGEDARAGAAATVMATATPAFQRAAAAITALIEHDAGAYENAIRAIVADFETRDEHLTGVPIADTALVLERLAAPRGMTAGVTSALLPSAQVCARGAG